jgi:hypothetical protein
VGSMVLGRMTHGAKASRSRGTQTALIVPEILQERKAAGLLEALENLRMNHGLPVNNAVEILSPIEQKNQGDLWPVRKVQRWE